MLYDFKHFQRIIIMLLLFTSNIFLSAKNVSRISGTDGRLNNFALFKVDSCEALFASSDDLQIITSGNWPQWKMFATTISRNKNQPQ